MFFHSITERMSLLLHEIRRNLVLVEERNFLESSNNSTIGTSSSGLATSASLDPLRPSNRNSIERCCCWFVENEGQPHAGREIEVNR